MENASDFASKFIIIDKDNQIESYFENSFQGVEIDFIQAKRSLMESYAEVLELYDLNEHIVWLGDNYIPKRDLENLYYYEAEKSMEENCLVLSNNISQMPVKVDGCIELVGKVRKVNPDKWMSGVIFQNVGVYKFDNQMLTYYNRETRILDVVQKRINMGDEFGWVLTDNWVHLGCNDGTSLKSDPEKFRECLKQVYEKMENI